MTILEAYIIHDLSKLNVLFKILLFCEMLPNWRPVKNTPLMCKCLHNIVLYRCGNF